MIYDILSDQQRKNYEELLEIDFSFALGEYGRFRVNVFKQNRGDAAVFRTIPNQIPTFEDLGLPKVLMDLARLEKGLVLVTGPTGSGKSTTLAAMVDLINNEMKGHIITIEDPIEFVHSTKNCLVNQRELGPSHPQFRQRPEERPPRGPRRHAHGRNEGPGHYFPGSHGRRDGPPGLRHPPYERGAEDHRQDSRRLPGGAAEPGAFHAFGIPPGGRHPGPLQTARRDEAGSRLSRS